MFGCSGRLPHLAPLTPDSLRRDFCEGFNMDDFREALA